MPENILQRVARFHDILGEMFNSCKGVIILTAPEATITFAREPFLQRFLRETDGGKVVLFQAQEKEEESYIKTLFLYWNEKTLKLESYYLGEPELMDGVSKRSKELVSADVGSVGIEFINDTPGALPRKIIRLYDKYSAKVDLECEIYEEALAKTEVKN